MSLFKRAFTRKPPQRVSRSRYISKGPTPRFISGDQAGEFNVLSYLGYSAVQPEGKPVRLKQQHHWYRVKCGCGKVEIHTQQQLIDTRRHRMCSDCINTLKENT